MPSNIIYTYTDEAPALATLSFLPIVKAFSKTCRIDIDSKDISLASRILAKFPSYLDQEQRVPDALKELGVLVKTSEANIIKLPNISASIPQLKATIDELQKKGFMLPNYPDSPENEEEKIIKSTYDQIKGSAVNPVLREGNSDRRAPQPVKEYARKNPHSMGKWASDSASHVSTMSSGDFASNEKSLTINKDSILTIKHIHKDGIDILKDNLPVLKGEIIDGTFMSKKSLIAFLEKEVKDAKDQDVLFSLHMKATMMKVSDPIIFGHCVKVFFKSVFKKFGEELNQIEVNVNNGFGNLLSQLNQLNPIVKKEIDDEIRKCLDFGPDIAMVDSDRGITNLHVPSDIIVDASMPAMIRNSGKMWNRKGEPQDTKAVIPDSSYASIFQVTIDFCKENGAFDPQTMGSVSNVGLMAKKAEEYGSHDKTFEISSAGKVQILDQTGKVLIEHMVEQGDIWRMCQVKDLPIQDWVKLAVNRAKTTGTPAIFWLNILRAHDAQLIQKVNTYLKDHNTKGLDIRILSPEKATKVSLKRLNEGKDTISVTGNVLRDYNTDLFPILELGTSAKMLSIVPLMNGGGLFETGAGGSAPKHVQQFQKENHLRWDSLGEFLALAVSFKHEAAKNNNPKAEILGEALNAATILLLEKGKSPSRKVKELDNRGSHYYIALYWSQELANQNMDTDLKETFSSIAESLLQNKEKIMHELNTSQGKIMNIEGYFSPNRKLATEAMRPSETFNKIIASI
ncbi:MAG: isocitrate dehydrogenase (NADP(+)) [Flavobacteriales bacterium]|nr:isocitrate dehydrogenase (NADP(+)) [Flavobacteriales bacterium]|tara:strand:+ start:4171 stop:6387 length:2217 start_codon:yes stop_codon:yes gene_type:complete